MLFYIIAARNTDQERITLADFMAACLYEVRARLLHLAGRKVGAEGDFYTSITVHAILVRVCRNVDPWSRCRGTEEIAYYSG